MSGHTQGEIAGRLARLAGAGVSELRLTGSRHQARPRQLLTQHRLSHG